MDSSIRVIDSVYDQVLEKYYGIEYKTNNLYDVTLGRKPENLNDDPVRKIAVEGSHLLYSKYEEEAVLYYLNLDTMTTHNFTGTFYVNNFDIQSGKGINTDLDDLIVFNIDSGLILKQYYLDELFDRDEMTSAIPSGISTFKRDKIDYLVVSYEDRYENYIFRLDDLSLVKILCIIR